MAEVALFKLQYSGMWRVELRQNVHGLCWEGK